MALNEVDQKILRKQDKDIIYRFLQDFAEKINLFIWQQKSKINESDFGIEKFQFSYSHHILEWKAPGPLKYGQVDEGMNPMGIKRSPMMLLQTKINSRALAQIIDYLGRQELPDDLNYIRNVVEKFQDDN